MCIYGTTERTDTVERTQYGYKYQVEAGFRTSDVPHERGPCVGALTSFQFIQDTLNTSSYLKSNFK